MAAYSALAAISARGFSTAVAQSPDVNQPNSPAAADEHKRETWLFPARSLNRILPAWIDFGGEYRTHVEGEDYIRYTTTKNAYFLSRFRLGLKIQPVNQNIQQICASAEKATDKQWKWRQTCESVWLVTTHDALYAKQLRDIHTRETPGAQPVHRP
jgi:hypothetical protein